MREEWIRGLRLVIIAKNMEMQIMRTFRYFFIFVMLSTAASSETTQKQAESSYQKYADSTGGMEAYNSGDYKTAFKIWLPAAELGKLKYMDYIGSLYLEGKGVIQDYIEAARWYRLSSDQGYAPAQMDLGKMYENGTGVAQSNIIAHMWYNISSAVGDDFTPEESRDLRDAIAKKMSIDDITKAQAMAQECISSGYKNCGD